MKSAKEGNLLRLIAIFLVAVTLVLTVGFAAEGLQESNENSNEGDESTHEPPSPQAPAPTPPDYVSYLTGLETTASLANAIKLCYVMNSEEVLYGIPGAELVIEIPTELGGSRLLSYIDENVTVEPKIGSITKTRDYISNIASFFGGLIISAGKDDTIDYSSIDTTASHVDLGSHVGYYYTDNNDNVYTNRNLIEALLLAKGIDANKSEVKMPFRFNGFFESPIKFKETAHSVELEYSEKNSTKFTYSADGEYILTKNGTNIVDPKSGSHVSYENVFILFADTTTYERIDGVAAVTNTLGSGIGYYLTEGTVSEIRWYTDEQGSLMFLNDSGTKLAVNRGKSYIAYTKASQYGSIKIK